MKIVRATEQFRENKDEQTAQIHAGLLQSRLEGIVAAWMRDTGLWDVDIALRVKPHEGMDGHFTVEASVATEAKPLRAEAGGVPYSPTFR